MEIPVSDSEAHEQIHQGRLIDVMRNTPGYIEVFKPALQMMLNKADADCHNFRLREDRGKYAIVRYNTIKEIMSICDVYIENMTSAIEYCKDNDIQF